jgi:BlaI family penicillinase repressor
MEIKLTDRETEVMAVLWNLGPSTVTEVRNALVDEFAYTTVLTVLRTLEAKGYVGHESEGRAHRYRATVALETARSSATNALIEKLFKGSTELLLTHVVSDGKLSDASVERIKRILDQHDKKGGASR